MRPPTDAEREALEAGLRSSDTFVLRRCQRLLASARGERVPRIAAMLGCGEQRVRDAIHAFNERGLAALVKGSTAPKTVRPAFDAARAEGLRILLHQRPRSFGKPTSVWTLELAAEVSVEHGLARERVSGETIRATLKRLGVRWQRAKRWITSPDPAYARKKRARDRLIRLARAHPEWALGFEDEVWWSRFEQPALHSWADPEGPLRLVEQPVAKDDPDPKALACYGLLVHLREEGKAPREELWLRFVDGRPVSAITTQFLAWCCERLARRGKTALLLVWDNASWHLSKVVRGWIRAHNRQAKATGRGVRLVVCPLPSKSPWLNPIEPKWRHGKRRVVEPDGLLSAAELEGRVCACFACAREPHLSIPQEVA